MFTTSNSQKLECIVREPFFLVHLETFDFTCLCGDAVVLTTASMLRVTYLLRRVEVTSNFKLFPIASPSLQ